MSVLTQKAALPEVLPAWQMASALEGLLKQLIDRASTITLSSLRTLGNGVDLLGELCRPGLPPDLATEPPFRFLTVDDDAISLKVVSRALSKALREPDAAKNSEEALALVAQRTYDVIFLDVQMPRMDGFELCTKILETELNRGVPVVYVTCQSDFDARVKATLTGGSDLIAKPFLTFELTVKALTLGLRARLERAGKPPGFNRGIELPPAVESQSSTRIGTTADSNGPTGLGEHAPAADSAVRQSSANSVGKGNTGEVAQLVREEAEEFFLHAAERLGAMTGLAEKILLAHEPAARQEMVTDLFLFLHGFVVPDGLPELRAAARVRSAMEALLKKLLEQPGNTSSSALETLTTALDLLRSLCVWGLNPRLATKPPIRLLVVDDDPVSRRIIMGALQVMFDKPDSAANGAAAIALAAKKPFEVIFMDVIMPGMDGFTACQRLRETKWNSQTPVVFVTNNPDARSRERAARCGGSGLIPKPFLGSELTLKALALALRGRLEKLGLGQSRSALCLPVPGKLAAIPVCSLVKPSEARFSGKEA